MITANGLNQIATNFESLVATVLLNGSVKVTEFTLEKVENHIYTLEFDIPASVTNLTRLEVLDANDNVIATNDLFVPIDQDARFKYVLTFISGR